MTDHAIDIPIDDLVEPRIILRLVDKNSVEYLELKDSIARHGFLNSICVRPGPTGKYEIVEGMYRYNCGKDLGLPIIPGIVKHGLTDEDVLALQIQANAIRPHTKPIEFARQLKKLMEHNSGITMAGLSRLAGKNSKWLADMLGLLHLKADEQKAVDRGEIPLGNAYMLAKMPSNARKQFIDQAKTLTNAQFKPIAAAFIKTFREASRQGKLEALFTAEFKPVAYLRSLKEVQQEYNGRDQGALVLAANNCQSPVEAWYLALQWAMSLDPPSVEEQRQNAMKREHQRLTPETNDDVAD